MKDKRMTINLVSSIISFFVNVGVSFILTPFVVEKLGNSAYGYLSLANNFVSYATVITIALDSVSGRFITIKLYEEDKDGADIYFNSVFLANIIMSVVLSIISLVVIINLQRLIKIPEYLVTDVKITFFFIILNFIITMLTSIFNMATFVKNRMDLVSIRNIQADVLKAIILVTLFFFFKAKLYFIGIAAVLMSLLKIIYNFKYTKELLPEIEVSLRKFKIAALVEMMSLGIWNSISNLSQILISGLDLLIANTMVGYYEMGLLSIAKTIPMAISMFLSTISRVYSPKFTILYAEKKMDEFVKEVKLSIRTLGLIVTVPLSGFIIFGNDFFRLWLPSLSFAEINKIQILSVLTLAPTFISAFVFTLYSINTITNKLKIPVIVSLSIGILSTLIVLILLKTTKLGIYAIAGVSSIMQIFECVIFVPIYAAKCLKIKYASFYTPILRGIISFIVLNFCFYIGHKFIVIESWIQLIGSGIIFGISGYMINSAIVLKNSEIKEALNMLKCVMNKIVLKKVKQ